MTRSILLALSALLATTAANADELRPLAGKSIALEAAAGVVYYTKETEGFRVVATMSPAEGAAPVRFVTTLADGQAVTIALPTEAGQTPREIEIRRSGEQLTIGDAQTLLVRASLD